MAPLTAYSYRLVAKDAAGNVSPPSNTRSVTTGDIFTDGFESGNLFNWTSASGLTVRQSIVDTGFWAALGTSNGAAGASASKQLDATVNELYYRVRVKLLSQGANSVSLLRFRTAANGALASAFISSTGKVGYRNDTSSTTVTSLQTVSPNIWHEVQMHVLVAGAGSQVNLWLDGIKVIGQADSLGTTPIGKIELGDPALNRSFDMAFDNVVVDPMFVTDALAPSAPSNLRSTNATPTQVDLAWDAASDDVGVTTYRLRRDGATIADVEGSTLAYADTGLGPGTQYTYTVAALDAAGHESPASDALQVTTTIDGPTGLTAVAETNQNRVDLSWSQPANSAGVAGYRIYRDSSPTPIGSVDGVATTTYSDSNVAPVTEYSYVVTAVDGAGHESDPSNPAVVLTSDTVPPSAPTGLAATPVSDIRVDLKWTAATDNVGVTGYRIYRNGSATPLASVGGATTTYSDTSVTSAQAYTYVVRAVDAAGNQSAASTTATATTPVFVDGFETGNLSRWTGSANFPVQNAHVFAGAWAGRAISNGGGVLSYAYKQLTATQAELYYQLRFKVVVKKEDVTLLRFRTASGTSILNLIYKGDAKLKYKSLGGDRDSDTTPAVGVWHLVMVHLRLNGASSQVEVWLNGAKIDKLSRTESLGTTPIGRIEVGEGKDNHKYDVAFDDVLIKKTP